MRDREQREPTLKVHFLSLTRRTPDCLLLSLILCFIFTVYQLLSTFGAPFIFNPT